MFRCLNVLVKYLIYALRRGASLLKVKWWTTLGDTPRWSWVVITAIL
jgi:hypothetical protein